MLASSLSIQAEVASRSRKSPRLEGSVTCLLFSGDCASSSVGMLEDGLVSSLVGDSNGCLILLFPLCEVMNNVLGWAQEQQAARTFLP